MRITMNLLVFCGVFLFLHKCQALRDDQEGDCQIDKVSDWNQVVISEILNDTDVGKEIFSSNYENIIGSDPSCASETCFFHINLDEDQKKLSILSNKNLLDIDGTFKRVDSPKQFITSINLKCSHGEKLLSFKVSVRDTNNHAPTFEKPSYEYLLPMPIPPRIDLMQFGPAINATDLDFSNQNITFSSNLKDLKYTTIIQADTDFPYILRLEFTKISRLSKNTTFELTATDWGTPETLSTSVTVTFNIDEANSEPYVPKFTQPSFKYKYNVNPFGISAVDQKVSLTESKDDVKCELVGDLALYFNEPTRDGKIIEITLDKQFPDDVIMKTVASMKVNCFTNYENPSWADLTILFPEDAKINTLFSKTTYSAEYSIKNDVQKVVMTDSISIENYVDDVIVEVDSYKKYFEIVKSAENSWLLSKKSDVNLDDNLLQRASLDVVISLILQSNNRVLDKAVITLLLPNGETRVSFTAPVFTGTYSFDKKNGDRLSIDSSVSLNSEYYEYQSAFVKEYPDVFQVTFEGSNKFEIGKIADLPEDLLKEGVLPLTIHIDFTLAGLDQSAESALVLYLADGTKSSTTEESTSQSSSTGQSTSQSSPTGESTSQSSPTGQSTSQSTPTSSPPNDCDNNNTVWIIIVIVLLLILLAYVGATLFYYFKKLRNGRNLSELPQPPARVEPHFQKRLSHDHKLKEVSTRRPTGFIRYNPDIEEGATKEDEEVNNNTAANRAVESPVEKFKKISESGKNVGFKENSAETEPTTLSDELKKAVKERESRLI